IADYADQTSKVESLVQQLADAQQSGAGVDAALKGFASQNGVAQPRLDSTAPTDQQASMLLKTVLPASASYDPLSSATTQVQQTGGLAAAVAGMFFGNAFGLATGGAAFLENLKGAVFPGIQFRSAFAQNGQEGALELCAKSQAGQARTHVAYLWAYRLPNLKPPDLTLTGPSYLPIGSASTLTLKAAKDSSVQQLAHAGDWRIVPVAGGSAAAVPVKLNAAGSLTLDLSQASLQPGDYKLTALWDWDDIALDGLLHLRKLPDFSHVQISPESRQKLIEGAGPVKVKLTGADFEFLEKAAVAKAAGRASSQPVKFTLPSGARAGDQESAQVEVDPPAHGAYLLALTQASGEPSEVPFTVLPPNPSLSGLPVHVSLQEEPQPLHLEGEGLDRVTAVSSDAGDIQGAPDSAKSWTGTIRLKAGAKVGATFAVALKLKDIDAPVPVPDCLKIFGPRPVITSVSKSVPATVGLTLQPDELPAGTVVGLSISYRHDDGGGAGGADSRPRVALGCKGGNLRKAFRLTPDDKTPGIGLSAASPGMLFLSLDPGLVGYPGCVLSATIDIEPEGASGAYALGRVVRVPQLQQFTLTGEQIDPSTYAGVLKGSGLDVIEKTGWDADHGVPVNSVPQPVPGDVSLQTLRIGLPWPSPSPHASLYVWFRGEQKGRKTTLTE
ncbi:MAG TPA: hypothetical protein VMU19_00135, partial [Bryobacteraceae bacterium]|nr:hypothetical protein [Bryobacteraceae bacterium]